MRVASSQGKQGDYYYKTWNLTFFPREFSRHVRNAHDGTDDYHPRGGAAAPPGVVVDNVVLEGHVVAAVGPGAQIQMIFWIGGYFCPFQEFIWGKILGHVCAVLGRVFLKSIELGP